MRYLIGILILLSFLAISLFNPGWARGDYAPDHPEYTRLTSRTMGMGNATVAWIDDASAIFHNPAGMGRINELAITNSHSRNHFPGPKENLDQLDADPTSFMIPLTGLTFGYPIGSAGQGWILQGELGYDYRERNINTLPQERLFGLYPGDRLQGAGFHLWPGGYFGFAHRRNGYLFTGGDDLPDGISWQRAGEGISVGLQQTIIPGIQYGYTLEDMDYSYLPFRGESEGERITSTRNGWAIRPTAWLLIARDSENISRKDFPSKDVTELVKDFWGVEIKIGNNFMVRWGSMDGHATSGWSWQVGKFRRDSAWVDGFMEEMVDGYPDTPLEIQTYHPTGFNWGR